MERVHTWKVVGIRGKSVCEMRVQAATAREARDYARRVLGFWMVMRTLAA